jgi:hypothetical protein
MSSQITIEKLRDIEKQKMQKYLERLLLALKNGKIEKLDFIFPTELLQPKERLKVEELGIEPHRVYENLVVFYFGRLYEIFDFEDVIFSTGEYPDAEATVNGKKVRIEFKVTSKQFNYDPSGCDLVICWEHDKPKIPLEVLQLKPLVEFIWKWQEDELSKSKTEQE